MTAWPDEGEIRWADWTCSQCGAWPKHACSLACPIRIERVIVPPFEVKAEPRLPPHARLVPGPRPDGSPVYAMRLEALKECHEIVVENFRDDWNDCHALRWSDRKYRDAFRARARRALANIRAIRMVLAQPIRQFRIRGTFSI